MQRASEDLVVRLEGTFDVPAARRVESVISRCRAGSTVRLDFTHVREFHDFGVAVLAQALKAVSGARVELKGLRLHQQRLLRYFGVDAPQAAPPGDLGHERRATT